MSFWFVAPCCSTIFTTGPVCVVLGAMAPTATGGREVWARSDRVRSIALNNKREAASVTCCYGLDALTDTQFKENSLCLK